MHAVGIVAAAGSGLRLGADQPKALVSLAGRPLVHWAVAALRAGGVRDVVVVVPAADRPAFAAVLPDDVVLVDGGATRTASVRAGLAAAGERADVVLVHDAARPLTPPDVVARVLGALAAGAQRLHRPADQRPAGQRDESLREIGPQTQTTPGRCDDADSVHGSGLGVSVERRTQRT